MLDVAAAVLAPLEPFQRVGRQNLSQNNSQRARASRRAKQVGEPAPWAPGRGLELRFAQPLSPSPGAVAGQPEVRVESILPFRKTIPHLRRSVKKLSIHFAERPAGRTRPEPHWARKAAALCDALKERRAYGSQRRRRARSGAAAATARDLEAGAAERGGRHQDAPKMCT
jgi:hypothetical protein